MRTPLKISYSSYLKNPKRPSAHYYARVRQGGKVRDIDLHTQDKAMADAWVRLRRSELERYNEYVLVGEEVPDELVNKIVRVDDSFSSPEKALAPSVTVRTAADEWEKHLRRKGRSEGTIFTYMRALRNCLDMNMLVENITAEVLKDSLAKHDKLKAASRKSYCVSVREFTKFLVKEYGLDRDLIDSFEFVQVRQEEKSYWTMQQMRQVIDNIRCMDPDVERCYKAWCWLMATTGARQGESALIEWSDIRGRLLTIRAENTKTNKTRTVPLSLGVLDLINRLPRKSKYVFADLADSQPGRYEVIVRAVRRAKVPHGALHTFRHSASMYLYSKIPDIKLVAQILGHSATTSIIWYQRTREAQQVADVVNKIYDEEQNLPSIMDQYIEAGLV